MFAIVKAVMPQLTEATAEQLTSVQAADLVRILELHASWDALLGNKGHKDNPAGLHTRQKTFAAYQSVWREFTSKNPNVQLPEPGHNVPDRLATWCRVLRVLFRLAGGSSRQVLAKAYRLADVIAVKMSAEPVVRTASENSVETDQG
ncbi:MAG: hypothetical protein C0467_33340, partial [Planctomycetaceae bacterium]|nr:hypothetical protein [Planctomycetaceae bacterium]